ncbi:biotin-dependent carboxyltransferase family protein [Flavobacteriaceae bacterium M23B6Z8]
MIKIDKPGFYTTIQDGGRFGFRNYGVPVSGAMDRIAYNQGNQLLGNSQNAASLEITMTGPSLVFEKNTAIAITGAFMTPKINDLLVLNNQVLIVNEGDTLSFGKPVKGFRAYLAVSGGFLTDEVLGSRSFMKNITKSDTLKENEYLAIGEFNREIPQLTGNQDTSYLEEETIYILKGPEFELLTDEQKEAIFHTTFSVSKDNNRMAYQLNQLVAPHNHSMLTSATIPGTVQLTPQGKLIILMRNGQTTGGYLRIFQLTERSISVLAQKKSTDQLRFKM